MNIVTNKDYEKALNDTVNKKIINKVKEKYKKYIPNEELETCFLTGLWKTLKNWDITKGRKFTSYLYVVCGWECKTWLAQYRKDAKYRKYKQLNDNISYNTLGYRSVSDLVSILPNDIAIVIEQKLIYNMTFKEIAEVNQYSHETARKRFLEGVGTLNNVIYCPKPEVITNGCEFWICDSVFDNSALCELTA